MSKNMTISEFRETVPDSWCRCRFCADRRHYTFRVTLRCDVFSGRGKELCGRWDYCGTSRIFVHESGKKFHVSHEVGWLEQQERGWGTPKYPSRGAFLSCLLDTVARAVQMLAQHRSANPEGTICD